jgi:5-methylthioadenosine/S-adenosylhomocysteine deaminase
MKTMVDILIRDGTLITVDPERRIIQDGAIAILKDRIEAIGKSDQILEQYEAHRVISGKNKLVMPGLINAHIHFFHHMHKGLAPENLGGMPWANWHNKNISPYLTAEDEVAGGMAVLLETLKSGTTTVLEAGSYFPEQIMEQIGQIGMRAIVGRRVFDQVILGHNSMAQTTAECLRLNESLLEKYKGGILDGRLTTHVNLLGMGRCSDELLIESKKMADSYGVVLNLHQAATIDEVLNYRARTGKRPVEHLDHLGILDANVVLVHVIHVNDREVELLREHEVNVVHCPSTALKLVYGLSAFGRFPEMMMRGVNVSLGTDASDCANYQDMIRLMYLAAVLFKDYRFDADVMGAETAIEMATINGACALGLEKDVGSLETGKKADLIVVDMSEPEWIPLYNPIQNLVYSATGSSVQTVLIDGQIVMEDRQVKTIDEQGVLEHCQGRARGVLARSGVKPSHLRWSIN